MIKKSIFEQDLINGMQKELTKIASDEIPSLSKAGEYLHSALEIFEEMGLQKSADQVLHLMQKIAANHHVKQNLPALPTFEQLFQVGLKPKDVEGMRQGDMGSRYRMNITLRNLGFDEKQIAEYIGHKNVVPLHDLEKYKQINRMIANPSVPHKPEDAAAYKKILHMIQNPTAPIPGQEKDLSFESLAPDAETAPGITPLKPQTLEFKSIGSRGRPRKPKRPDSIHRHPGLPHHFHMKDLTPEKMMENLENHGTVFDMADDGLDISSADFDTDFADALGVNNANDLDVNDIDIGYQDITDAEDDLQDFDQKLLDDFEDERSQSK